MVSDEKKEEIQKKLKERVIKKTKVKKKNKGICKYCGCNNPLMMTVDHRVPLVRGGADSEENMDCVCFICNYIKGPLNEAEFKKYFKALKNLRSIYKIKLVIQDPKLEFSMHNYPGFFDKEKQ